MIYGKHTDLLDRRKRLGWTNITIANIIGCSPSAAGSKLLGFTTLRSDERRKLEKAMADAEQQATEAGAT